ncbi:protein hunchback-like isoform X2 [Paramacrobiotus metropolitanus]|uniref:protein hunchback-like isoform X2 n=1 Tax=Paramacrobiotus metropolitanus TaxID=2943436 RepID=UPI002445BC5F|nr:protein hunchback-like isoform X2 [Paramacrobiotus metropolitanus]
MAYTEPARDTTTNYLEQIRSMLVQRANHDPYGVALDKDPDRTSLAKLIRSGPALANTSVIQAAPARSYSPVDVKMPPALATPLNGYGHVMGGVENGEPLPGRRLSNGFEESVIVDSRRFSTSKDMPEISPSSAGSEAHHDLAEVPGNHGVLDNGHDLDSIPPLSPKSEASGGSVCSERSGYEPATTIQYTNLLRQQLLQRQTSLLQYRLQGGHPGDHEGGSDAEAEHTSNSPSSSELPEGGSTPPPQVGQEFHCQICDFHSTSRFHYNSHMNTHQVHRCPIPECNYSTRTEGRLRRHVKGHHQQSRDSSVGGEDDGTHSGGESKSRRASDVDSTTGMAVTQGSSGKVKNYRCKQCLDFVAANKNEHYDHLRLHIKAEKQLACPMDGCRFVTEYKHHLEYHVRNHSGSKPFKCPNANCNYTCVNKSMLNSHMKSHSNFYQYRCECGYATKYCHSLKLHLKKYNHKATNNGPESAQLSMAASPQSIITASPVKSPRDEHHPKRRSRPKKPVPQEPSVAPHPPPVVSSAPGGGGFGGFPMAMPEAAVSVPQAFPYSLYPPGFSQFQAASIYNNLLLSAAAANGLINPAMRMNMARPPLALTPENAIIKRDSPTPPLADDHQTGNNLENLGKRKQKGVLRMLPQSRVIRSSIQEPPAPNGLPLDLSGSCGKENGHSSSATTTSSESQSRHSDSPKSNGSSAPDSTGDLSSSSRRRRKGPAFKIDLAVRQRLQDALTEEDEPSGFLEEEKCPIIQPESPEDLRGTESVIKVKKPRRELACEHCGMAFEDGTMYTMHMGFHGRDSPYTCGLCGHQAMDRVSFFLHIAKAPHY